MIHDTIDTQWGSLHKSDIIVRLARTLRLDLICSDLAPIRADLRFDPGVGGLTFGRLIRSRSLPGPR